jgi:UDP-N-acetylmuramyl pentapeptide synthase
MISRITSFFGPTYPKTLAYMLQSTEYQVKPYLAWYWRTNNFKDVSHRRSLDKTRRARLLVAGLRIGIALQIIVGVIVLIQGIQKDQLSDIYFGIAILLAYPVIWAHLIVIPLLVARFFIVLPKDKRAVKISRRIFEEHGAIKIAVAGSYGKTTMKELLLTILGEGKKVAATPANKNVAISHAHFAKKLTGDEEVIIIEYGEGAPGDVARFAKNTKPTIGIITGLAPAHLDKYKTLDSAARDILSLADFLKEKNVYINNESNPLKKYKKSSYIPYDQHSVLGWKISNIHVHIDGMSFFMEKNGQKLSLQTGLIGRHLIGSLALCVALAKEIGCTDRDIIAGVAKTIPFEHRMQPREMAGGFIIDDTYNGNLEGVRAGLQLLSELDSRRKIYVTPGLVDQGKESMHVHQEMGKLIAKANPTKVVLMKNSVTHWICDGLASGGYKGELVIEKKPLDFYTNINQIIAAGDIMMLQNDWTDNYK